MIFFTSDLHFGHEKIIRNCHRPFKDVEDMNSQLIENWNATVGSRDDIYILGDFALRLEMSTIHALLEQLKGRKHLIFGNHDHEIARHRYYFRDVLCSMNSLFMMRISGDRRLLLCHYPLMYWCGDYDDRFIHLYGHIHNNAHDMKWARHLRNSYNVGVDVNDYRPVDLDTVLKKVAGHNAELPLDQCVNPPLSMRSDDFEISVSYPDPGSSLNDNSSD